MTWNVENLFRAGAESGPPDEAAYRAKPAYLTQTITAVAPDVVAVREIGEPGAAPDLRAAIGRGWHLRLSDHHDARGIRVGVLSPHPLVTEADIVKLPAHGLPSVPDVDGRMLREMRRGALQVNVQLPGGRPFARRRRRR